MDKLTFWNDRANLGFQAGTNDKILKQMEMDAISAYISDGISILDFGCGNGITMNFLSKKYDVKITGIDFSCNMIAEAKKLAIQEKTIDKLTFFVGDETIFEKIDIKFDIIYSERSIINLDSWKKQKDTIIGLCNLLKKNGKYIMCESSLNGLQEINTLRKSLNLEVITPPWHNRYIIEEEILELNNSGIIKLVEINDFSSTYYFLSRIVNAALALQSNQPPSYDSPINKLALHLPPIGNMGQGKIWVWEKIYKE